jgi:hypothetical protein
MPKAGDYTRMASIYPDADRAPLSAQSSSLGPDMPLAVRQSVHSIRALSGDDEALTLAVINHDAAARHAAYVATLADIKNNLRSDHGAIDGLLRHPARGRP